MTVKPFVVGGRDMLWKAGLWGAGLVLKACILSMWLALTCWLPSIGMLVGMAADAIEATRVFCWKLPSGETSWSSSCTGENSSVCWLGEPRCVRKKFAAGVAAAGQIAAAAAAESCWQCCRARSQRRRRNRQSLAGCCCQSPNCG
ncbi:hypothetical protein BX661DRAFT_29381 [Kickxella alabastrina]|uniref:uncharacterized protein n=1 Tax=Kickxella alabastrina TaxID=61397 RepID=UPI00221F0DF3|nr:uncharacterized protein BX661DRAFT_29381 [Kickxella alabastrina]KAI7826684.1 hypothetical protein BX661DRAFT_29381 [Kickxella alabastrina]